MLPGSGCVAWLLRCMVKSPDRKGDDHGTAAAREVGPGRPRRAGTPLPHHPRRHHPDPLPDDPAARRGPPGGRGRPVDPLQPRHGPPCAQALPGGRARCRAAPAPSGQPPHYPPAWEAELVRVADLDPHEVGVEALLAAAAAAVPPPAVDLVPDATLADALMPEDLPRLLGLLERADLYLQDEVEVALHPTLTRVWSRAGRAGQRLVQAPGKNFKRCGFGLV